MLISKIYIKNNLFGIFILAHLVALAMIEIFSHKKEKEKKKKQWLQ